MEQREQRWRRGRRKKFRVISVRKIKRPNETSVRSGAASADNFRSLRERKLERETGFEPATSTLARSHSTTELFPPAVNTYVEPCKVPHGGMPIKAGPA